MNIPDIEDFQRLESKMDSVLEILLELKGDKAALLTAEEIFVTLKLSYRSFQRRIPQLKKFGMYKDGRGYRMKESDLDKYIKAHHQA